jgi:hypothetical protein
LLAFLQAAKAKQPGKAIEIFEAMADVNVEVIGTGCPRLWLGAASEAAVAHGQRYQPCGNGWYLLLMLCSAQRYEYVGCII